MTDREKAIVMAYTGVTMLKDDKLQIFYKYVEEIMGRPIWTHEMAQFADDIKEKSKDDFMALCADEGSSEKPYKWIPVSERLPEIDEDGYSSYVLVSFSNFTLPFIGQLRKTDGENHWYEGDDEKALDSFGLHVNAWMPLPKPYRTESEGNNEI